MATVTSRAPLHTTADLWIYTGTGDPNTGLVPEAGVTQAYADPAQGSIFMQTDGASGKQMWIKQAGNNAWTLQTPNSANPAWPYNGLLTPGAVSARVADGVTYAVQDADAMLVFGSATDFQTILNLPAANVPRMLLVAVTYGVSQQPLSSGYIYAQPAGTDQLIGLGAGVGAYVIKTGYGQLLLFTAGTGVWAVIPTSLPSFGNLVLTGSIDYQNGTPMLFSGSGIKLTGGDLVTEIGQEWAVADQVALTGTFTMVQGNIASGRTIVYAQATGASAVVKLPAPNVIDSISAPFYKIFNTGTGFTLAVQDSAGGAVDTLAFSTGASYFWSANYPGGAKWVKAAF